MRSRAAVLTAAAARLVEPFHITDWNGLLDILTSDGLRQISVAFVKSRRANPEGRSRRRYKPRDDTAVACLSCD